MFNASPYWSRACVEWCLLLAGCTELLLVAYLNVVSGCSVAVFIATGGCRLTPALVDWIDSAVISGLGFAPDALNVRCITWGTELPLLPLGMGRICSCLPVPSPGWAVLLQPETG